MTVTQIKERSRSLSEVFIDFAFAFVLYKGELRHYGLREGEEISEETYHAILEDVLPRRAKLRCMNLLKSRDYTVSQLRRKLEQGGYPEKVIGEALDYVASYHYLDDERYALEYIDSCQETRSRRRMEQDLISKGIPRDTVEAAFEKWEARGGVQDEGAMIAELLRKRHYDPETADLSEKRRVYAFLFRKGYAPEQIARAMR